MQQDNTYSVDPNNLQAQVPEMPPVANPLNTGNGNLEIPADTPQVEAPVNAVQMPDNQPHEIEIQPLISQQGPPVAQPEIQVQPAPEVQAAPQPEAQIQAIPEAQVTPTPDAQPQTEAEIQPMPETEVQPMPPVQEVAQSITQPVENPEITPQESKVKSYIIASVVLVAVSAFGFVGYKFLFSANGTDIDENVPEAIELTNSLTSDVEESTEAEAVSIEIAPEEAPVDKLEELDEVVNELKEIYSPESEVSEDATLTEVSATEAVEGVSSAEQEGGVDR